MILLENEGQEILHFCTNSFFSLQSPFVPSVSRYLLRRSWRALICWWKNANWTGREWQASLKWNVVILMIFLSLDALKVPVQPAMKFSSPIQSSSHRVMTNVHRFWLKWSLFIKYIPGWSVYEMSPAWYIKVIMPFICLIVHLFLEVTDNLLPKYASLLGPHHWIENMLFISFNKSSFWKMINH